MLKILVLWIFKPFGKELFHLMAKLGYYPAVSLSPVTKLITD
jgi:hypothetical protein